MLIPILMALISAAMLARAMERSWTRAIGFFGIMWVAIFAWWLGLSSAALFWMMVLK